MCEQVEREEGKEGSRGSGGGQVVQGSDWGTTRWDVKGRNICISFTFYLPAVPLLSNVLNIYLKEKKYGTFTCNTEVGKHKFYFLFLLFFKSHFFLAETVV